MLLVTGATGHLGRLTIDQLLKSVPAAQIVAMARNKDKAKDLAASGVAVRIANYDDKQALKAALTGIDKVLLISANEVGKRFDQHKNVIDVAKEVGVGLIAYTSILNAEKSPLGIAREHLETEIYLRATGVPHVLLRNGWYTENYTASIPVALESGVVYGCAGEGRISSAARQDYAAAAASVLLKDIQDGTVYELAGDDAYTLSEYAAQLAQQTGKEIVYQNLSEAEYAAALKNAGLPDVMAQLLSDSDTGASQGGLFDDSKTLSSLIGRPTTALTDVIKQALVQNGMH